MFINKKMYELNTRDQRQYVVQDITILIIFLLNLNYFYS